MVAKPAKVELGTRRGVSEGATKRRDKFNLARQVWGYIQE